VVEFIVKDEAGNSRGDTKVVVRFPLISITQGEDIVLLTSAEANEFLAKLDIALTETEHPEQA
jgi:hypothetical protein